MLLYIMSILYLALLHEINYQELFGIKELKYVHLFIQNKLLLKYLTCSPNNLGHGDIIVNQIDKTPHIIKLVLYREHSVNKQSKVNKYVNT